MKFHSSEKNIFEFLFNNMKLVLFSVLIGTAFSFVPFGGHIDFLWEDYKREFGKSYDFGIESQRRFAWEQNVLHIVNHNLKADFGFSSFRTGLNEYSNLSLEEHMKLLTGYKNTSKPTSSIWEPPQNAFIPDEVDWRNEGLVTPVKNQKLCGASWAFAATGALEGQHKKKTGKLVSLSEQNLVDCSEDNDSCNGGSLDASFEYVKVNHGIDTESSYPYEAVLGTCRFKASGVGATCAGRVDLTPGDEDALQQAVATVGPISVIIDASHNSFINYKSGILDEPECQSDFLNHALLVIGYGTEDGLDYWLLKNSWGTTWGMEGFIKMSRNKNNQCGIASLAAYPLV